MIQVVPFEKINRTKWDACIHSGKNGNIYGLYDSICMACDRWVGIIYNDYQWVLALPQKKKLGLTYSWHPQFMGPLGIFGNEEDPQIQQKMLEEMIQHSWWVKMFYFQPAEGNLIKPTLWKYQQLGLAGKNMEDVRKEYNENTKRNRQKAVKQGIEIKKVSDVDLVINTFKENKGDQIENINEDSYVLLRKLMIHWLQKNDGHITGVYDGEILLAIGYFLTWRKTVTYYKGAVTNEGKNSGAMHFLIDSEINDHINKCDFFDFGGSNTESVARFYKGFGGKDVDYYLNEYKKFKI